MSIYDAHGSPTLRQLDSTPAASFHWPKSLSGFFSSPGSEECSPIRLII